MICDIALYGHLTFDIIFDGKKTRSSIGSIGNVWKGLKYINNLTSIAVEPTMLGEALILIDRINNRRTSKACLNQKQRIPTIHSAKWNHILYINELDNLSFLQQLDRQSIVSADICSGKIINKSILKYINILFLSEDEESYDVHSLAKEVKTGIIYHSPNSASFISKDDQVITQENTKLLTDCNTLGAGDFFAASCIHSLLNNMSMLDVLKLAHQQTGEMIKNEI